MFDMKAEIGLSIPTPEGAKRIVVRFPTDAEYIDWHRKKKIVRKDIGRDNFEMEESQSDKWDAALVTTIRKDAENGPPLDESEAEYAIGRLTHTEITEDPEREGSAYTIRLKIMRKLMTSHTLRIPSVKETMDYERQRSSVIFGKYGRREIRINDRAAAELYDRLKQATDGYVADIPVKHKADVINVLLQEIARKEESSESDDDQD